MGTDVVFDRYATARFSGLPARQGPLTVGQRNVLQWLGKAGTAAIGLNRWVFTIPGTVSTNDMVAALATVLARYEALRTAFDLAPDHPNRRRQLVAGDGSLKISIFRSGDHVDETAAAKRLETMLRAMPIDHRHDLPIRVALLIAGDDKVRVGLMLYSHLALDVGGAALVGRDVTRLLAGQIDADASGHESEQSWQPIDRANWECSEKGTRQLSAALQYWQTQLRIAPHCMYAVPVANDRVGPPIVRDRAGFAAGDGPGPGASAAARRSPAFEIRSPAGAIAVPHIAARTATSPTMVVVAAFAAVLAHRTRHRRCAYVTLVGNRMGRHLHGYVGTLAGPSLVVVDTTSTSFDDLVRQTGAASLAAARHAVVDVGELNESSRAVYRQRGVMFSRDVVVNNIHHALGQSVNRTPRPLDSLSEAIAQSSTQWTDWERVPQLLNFRMFRLDDSALTFRLATASVRWVPATDLRMLALGVEKLLIAAATGDVDLTRLTDVTGVVPVHRGPDWHYLDGCWVELNQARRLLADALAPARTGVFVESTSDGLEELVGYFAGSEVTDIEQVHDRCVDALPGPLGLEYHTYTTIAPMRYVRCADAPDDVGDLAGWRRQVVLSRGDGRGVCQDEDQETDKSTHDTAAGRPVTE